MDKKRNEPKEQRKPRNARNQASKVEQKKNENVEESRSAPKVPQKPPVYEDPGPEFYKNLKRETDEILKITEEENSKYKKKEIQSNWSKYEMPIESYDEIEEHDVGADYEKLIQAPLSIGSHFQFKHEKSWDVNTGPSLYDKYFEFNMDNLFIAVSTIPFYERNSVDESLFSESDMLSMNNRATKYKQKYYDDKTYSTPETEAQDRILNSFKESLSKNHVDGDKVEASSVKKEAEISENFEENMSARKDVIDLDFSLVKTDISTPIYGSKEIDEKENKSLERKLSTKSTEDFDDLMLHNTREKNVTPILKQEVTIQKIIDPPIDVIERDSTIKSIESTKIPIKPKSTGAKPKDIPVETKKNPVIESPEDLEKWLDDFLDG